MPVRDTGHWEGKMGDAAPCHYGDWYLDTYADIVRKAATRRIFPGRRLSVLDVGCGDGKFGEWVKEKFACRVDGVDAFDWPGAAGRLDKFSVLDAEEIVLAPNDYDLAICVTSLPFMRDWRMTVKNLCRSIPKVLVIENLQTPTPPWNKGMVEKDQMDYPTLVWTFENQGFFVADATCINVLDRRLFFTRMPTPLAFAASLLIDLIASYVVRPWAGRYAAVLFERKA